MVVIIEIYYYTIIQVYLLILEKGYFWEGLNNDINSFIKNFPIYNPKHIKKIKNPM